MTRSSAPRSGAWSCLPLILIGASAQSAAQDVARWEDFEPCGDADAELVLHEVMRLGDAEGDGMIESDVTNLSWSEEVGYFVGDGRGSWFKVFDHDGRFVRKVGRSGEGPGEFGHVAAVRVVENRIVALDASRRQWQLFDLDGEFLDQRDFGFSAALFEPVGGALVVVAVMDRRPEFVGYPLHLVDIGEGAPSMHFGAEEPANWKATDPWARSVVVGPGSRAGTVWGGKAGIPTAQEWSADGEALRRIEGELPWFPRLARHPDPRRMEPDGPLFGALMGDADDRLWMQTLVSDARWRETMAEGTAAPGGEVFVPPEDHHKLVDLRLDGFDLGRQCRLGYRVEDDRLHAPKLFRRGGEAMAYGVSHDDPAALRIVVYRIGWQGRAGRPSGGSP